MTHITETPPQKFNIKSALIGAVATVIIMGLCALPYLIVQANDRYEQGQKAMIDRHKLENKGVLR